MKRVILRVAVLLAALSMFAATPNVALAGSDGQQIQYCWDSTKFDPPFGIQYTWTYGWSNYDHYWNGVQVNNNGNNCGILSGWWWDGYTESGQGPVKITWQGFNGYDWYTTCYVPESQSSNIYTCWLLQGASPGFKAPSNGPALRGTLSG